nr:hypothetical protein [Tanacetum cinerariifolium]
MSPDDVYNHLKVYEPEVQKKSGSNSKNIAFISSSNTSSGNGEVHIASVPTASIQVFTASTDVAATSLSHDTICAYIATQSNGFQIKYEDITQIDEDDIEEMYIKWNMALLSMRADRFWKKTGIDGIGWDWSYMANEEENHALVADDEVPTEFALMAKSSSSSDNEGNPHNNIDDKGYWNSGCSRYMIGNISYLSEYEPYDGGYVSFGHGGGKITRKGIIKT